MARPHHPQTKRSRSRPDLAKPAGTTVDPRNGRRLELPGSGGEGRLKQYRLPRRQPAWSAASKRAWASAWQSEVSVLWTEADRSILDQWIDAIERSHYFNALADREITRAMRRGEDVVIDHDGYKVALQYTKVAAECARQLGLGPLNRISLGIAVIDQHRSASLDSTYGYGHDDDDDGLDPRRPDGLPDDAWQADLMQGKVIE